MNTKHARKSEMLYKVLNIFSLHPHTHRSSGQGLWGQKLRLWMWYGSLWWALQCEWFARTVKRRHLWHQSWLNKSSNSHRFGPCSPFTMQHTPCHIPPTSAVCLHYTSVSGTSQMPWHANWDGDECGGVVAMGIVLVWVLRISIPIPIPRISPDAWRFCFPFSVDCAKYNFSPYPYPPHHPPIYFLFDILLKA